MPLINASDQLTFVTSLGAAAATGTADSSISVGLNAAADDDVMTIEAGGTDIVKIQESGVAIQSGRLTETLTVVDDDAQSFTLAVADIKAGINVHTSVTGGGTVTCDTGANIIAGVPLTADNQCVVSYYVNDGNQTATFAVAAGTTISNVANTVKTNEAATLIWRRTASDAVVLYIVTS